MSIIALTLLVRAVLLPLTLKQFKSMQAMARPQPEMKKLQERYKDDKERLNQEMMKFYRENKINPFASCLPLVAQLPVFLSLFYMLRTDLRFDICPDVRRPTARAPASPVPCGDGGDAQFLFIPDLTNKATGAVLVVLIVLYVGSQLASTLLMSTTTDKTQRHDLPGAAVPLRRRSWSASRPACSSTGSRRTCGRSSSRRSSGSGSGRCDRRDRKAARATGSRSSSAAAAPGPAVTAGAGGESAAAAATAASSRAGGQPRRAAREGARGRGRPAPPAAAAAQEEETFREA